MFMFRLLIGVLCHCQCKVVGGAGASSLCSPGCDRCRSRTETGSYRKIYFIIVAHQRARGNYLLSEDMAMMIIFLNINTGDQSEGHGVDKEAESLNARSDQDPVL